MVRKSTTIAVTSILVATGLMMVACSGDDEDDNTGSGGGSGTGATAGKGGTGGTAGKGTGGTTPTAGTGGTTPTAGTGGTTGGTTAAGGAGAGGTAGAAAGSGGGGGMQGFACAGKMATCNLITDFSTSTAVAWGSGDFTGGVTVFSPTGSTFARDTTDTGAIKVTGKVTNYGFGFGLWFSHCMSLSNFTGVEFTISGTTTATVPNVIQLQVQTNSDYPWQPAPTAMKGGCTAVDATNPWGECIAPVADVTMMPTATAMPVLWAGVGGGTPVVWDAASSPAEIVGIQWQFPWAGAADTEYDVDVTLESVKLISAEPDETCMVVSGTGGMGGAGAGGASSGGMAGATSGGGGAGGQATGGGGQATGGGGASAGGGGKAGASGSANGGGGAGNGG